MHALALYHILLAHICGQDYGIAGGCAVPLYYDVDVIGVLTRARKMTKPYSQKSPRWSERAYNIVSGQPCLNAHTYRNKMRLLYFQIQYNIIVANGSPHVS